MTPPGPKQCRPETAQNASDEASHRKPSIPSASPDGPDAFGPKLFRMRIGSDRPGLGLLDTDNRLDFRILRIPTEDERRSGAKVNRIPG